MNQPTIVGYFDDLNLVYSAIVRGNSTLVKHMVTPPSPKKLLRVEMKFTGYSFYPVRLLDPFYNEFIKVSHSDAKQPPHWAVNWFLFDYKRWLIVNQHSRKEVIKILGTGCKKEQYNRPTTKFIATVTLSRLLAAHVCFAHCIDVCEDKISNVEDLLDLYVNHFNLTDKHGKLFRHSVLKIIKTFDLDEIKERYKDPHFTIGVDTFIV